jgi:iron complex outermembrane receptor protein
MNRSIFFLRILAGTDLTVLLAGIGSTALAQDAAGTGGQSAGTGARLEEIIVTAQKREQNLQNVGTSITALDGTALGKLGLTDAASVAGQTPGMQFNQYSPTVTVYNLRGVSQNDFSDHQEAPIAVYTDDVYVASMSALSGTMFDLARVEVLRGPQGTLFGRNATGGLIQYISEKPKFEDDASFSVTGGNYSTVNSEGFVNAAISDSLATRLSFATDYHSGYVQNRLGPDLGNQNQYSGRVQFLYRPSDAGEILVKFYALNDDHETGAAYSWEAAHPDATGRAAAISPTSTANCPDIYGGCTPGGDSSGYRNTSTSPFLQSYGTPGYFNRTIGGSTVHVSWNFDMFSLTSVTDYMHLQKHYDENSSMGPNPAFFSYEDAQNYHQASQEVRLNGGIGSLRWITGAYFLDLSTHCMPVTSTAPVFGGVSGANYSLSTRSEAGFAQAEYDLASALTAIAGVRYTSDQKDFDYYYFNAPQTPTVYNPSTDPSAARIFDNVSGKAELDYKFDQDSMVYASWNRGAKGGGWSAPVSGVVNTANLPYGQETLNSYEIGEKVTFLGGSARLDGALFYYDYHNYQGFFLEGLTTAVENVQAIVKGGELEFAWVPFRGANVQVGVSNLESIAFQVPLPSGITTDAQMPQAPKWTVNGSASYDWVIAAGKITFEADAKWNGTQHLELENAPADLEPDYVVANTRLSYTTSDDRFQITAWVKNLTDRWYRVYSLDLSVVGLMQNVYGPPRTFGATAVYRWSW